MGQKEMAVTIPKCLECAWCYIVCLKKVVYDVIVNFWRTKH